MRLKYLQLVAETTYWTAGFNILCYNLCDKLNIFGLLFFLELRCIISVPPDMEHFALIFNFFNFS